MNHMMIDLETFGTGNNAAIVQIGAVVFDMFTPSVIQRQWTIPLQWSILAGGEVDASTVEWWRKQSDLARASIRDVNRGGDHTLISVLTELSNVYDENTCERVWSHGLIFDVPILDGYYRRLALAVPWKYRDTRDTRTLFDLAQNIGWVKPLRSTAHTAVADAMAQADDVRSAWSFIVSIGIKKPTHAEAYQEVLKEHYAASERGAS